MRYYIDTEFLEGTQKENFPISLFRKNTHPTIDLISVGIIAGDGREYYAISKDFNLKEAWNRHDGYKTYTNLPGDTGTNKRKNYWVRENVLHNLHYDLLQIERPFKKTFEQWKEDTCKGFYKGRKNYKSLKRLLSKYGKTNKQIAEEIKDFVLKGCEVSDKIYYWGKTIEPKFYAYGQENCFVFINFMKNYGSL